MQNPTESLQLRPGGVAPEIASPTRPRRGLAHLAAILADWPPERVFWSFVAAHLALWMIVPSLVQHNLPLDDIELLGWGREWLFAYYTHPPLPAWILEIVADATNRWQPALYGVGAVWSTLSLIAIWRLGCAMLGPLRALPAVLAQEGVIYFSLFLPEFNHNVVLLPLWAALGLVGYRICFQPAGPAVTYWRWVAFGVLAALGMYGKYITPLLLVPILVFSLVRPRLRRMWATPGPWLALGIALLLLAPHIAALPHVHYGPLLFPFHRAGSPAHWYDHLLNPVRFIASQSADVMIGMLTLGLLASDRAGPPIVAAPRLSAEQRAYLATITWAPAGIAVGMALLVGLHFRDMWGYPMWCFIGLFVVAEWVGPFTRRGLERCLAAALVILPLMPVAYVVQQSFGWYFNRHPMRGQFPGRELARAVEQGWHAVEGTSPLAVVVGDQWVGGNVAFYSAERPSLFVGPSPERSPWITEDTVRQKGAALVWEDTGPPPEWLQRFPGAQPQPPIMLNVVPAWGEKPHRFDWAILPPAR